MYLYISRDHSVVKDVYMYMHGCSTDTYIYFYNHLWKRYLQRISALANQLARNFATWRSCYTYIIIYILIYIYECKYIQRCTTLKFKQYTG